LAPPAPPLDVPFACDSLARMSTSFTEFDLLRELNLEPGYPAAEL
jgi:hypothetical protein